MGGGASCRDHQGRSVDSQSLPNCDCEVRVTGLRIRGPALLFGFGVTVFVTTLPDDFAGWE